MVKGAGELAEVAALGVAMGIQSFGDGALMVGSVVCGAAGHVNAELRIEN